MFDSTGKIYIYIFFAFKFIIYNYDIIIFDFICNLVQIANGVHRFFTRVILHFQFQLRKIHYLSRANTTNAYSIPSSLICTRD